MVKSMTRSQTVKNRWELAEKKQQLYTKFISDKNDFTKRDFYKKENPLDSSIKVYYVSAQANYMSSQGGIYTEPKTFRVIAIESNETPSNIIVASKVSFASMKINGQTFNPQFQRAIENNTDVSFDKIRGLEEVNEKLTPAQYEKLYSGDFVVEGLDKGVKFAKNKKKGMEEKKKFRGELDLTFFL